jgi:hypothetical protein
MSARTTIAAPRVALPSILAAIDARTRRDTIVVAPLRSTSAESGDQPH